MNIPAWAIIRLLWKIVFRTILALTVLSIVAIAGLYYSIPKLDPSRIVPSEVVQDRRTDRCLLFGKHRHCFTKSDNIEFIRLYRDPVVIKAYGLDEKAYTGALLSVSPPGALNPQEIVLVTWRIARPRLLHDGTIRRMPWGDDRVLTMPTEPEYILYGSAGLWGSEVSEQYKLKKWTDVKECSDNTNNEIIKLNRFISSKLHDYYIKCDKGRVVAVITTDLKNELYDNIFNVAVQYPKSEYYVNAHFTNNESDIHKSMVNSMKYTMRIYNIFLKKSKAQEHN